MYSSRSMPSRTLLILLCAAQVGTVRPAERFVYTILMNNAAAGREVDTFGDVGVVDSTFEFNDRGRGPKITARYVVAPSGVPTEVDLTGNDYLKAPVDEHFRVTAGRGEWRSTSEQGSGTGSSFYVSNNGPMAEMAMLVSALQKAKNNTLPLLPAGEARLERLTDVVVTRTGDSRHVTEYAITGLSFEPATVWLSDDQKLFAVAGNWFAVVLAGWEHVNQQLHDLDVKARDARYAQLAQQLARRPAGAVAIEHVRLFDSETATTRDDQTVVVNNGRVASVGPSASATVPDDAERVDGRGRTLLPGLFDMHVHSSAVDGLLNIASGVTSVRDLGSDIDDLRRLQTQWDSGAAIGPRVSKAGFVDGPGPFQAPTGLYVSTADEARAAVNKYADLGYIQIKVYSSLKPELVPVIVEAAHARGLRVSGHIPNGMIASQFVEAGADELQHINFIFLNFLAGKVKDTRTPERFTAVGEHAAALDLQSSDVRAFVDLLLRHHTTVDVTLDAFESMFTARPGQVAPSMAPVLSRLPAQVQRQAYTGGLPATGPTDARYRESYAAMLRMTKRLYDAGVPILAGTDDTAGLMLHHELELEVKAGIPPASALQIATYHAATLLKQEKDLGSIAPGKIADLVLVEGNPVADISTIRRCRLVMKGGVMYSSADVYAAAGIGAAK